MESFTVVWFVICFVRFFCFVCFAFFLCAPEVSLGERPAAVSGEGREKEQKLDEGYLSTQLKLSQENLPQDGFGCWEGEKEAFEK